MLISNANKLWFFVINGKFSSPLPKNFFCCLNFFMFKSQTRDYFIAVKDCCDCDYDEQSRIDFYWMLFTVFMQNDGVSLSLKLSLKINEFVLFNENIFLRVRAKNCFVVKKWNGFANSSLNSPQGNRLAIQERPKAREGWFSNLQSMSPVFLPLWQVRSLRLC